MYQRREYREDEQITVGFKATGKLAGAVHHAAELAGFPSTTQWLRKLATEAAAKALGVTAESLEPPRRFAKAGLTAPGATPAVAAQLAQYNALILDLQDKLKQAAALAGVPVVAPAKSRRR